MATLRSSALLTCSVLLVITCCLLQRVHGHLYMMTPVSRNLWGTTAFNDASFDFINFCPHCYQSRGPALIRQRAEMLTDPAVLELYGNGAWPLLTAYERGEVAANGNFLEIDAIAVRHGICGDPEQTASEDSNRNGRANTNYPVIDTYTEGSIVEIKIVVSTSHVGHLEFFLCDTADMDDPDGVVNQECFNMHPLDRAGDDGSASPIDPDFPGRYYLDPPCRSAETDQTLLPGAFPGDVTTARYQLPSGVTCSRCILQMVYYTGNSCMHVGYDEFNPPSWPSECAPNKEDWIQTGLSLCGVGDSYPEEYWNCADIEIVADGSPTNPAPIPEPSEPETPAPINEETPAPINGATPAPINMATPSPTNVETPGPINSDTPAPITIMTPYPITMMTSSPVDEETPAPETPAPTLSAGEPFSNPISITLPPATFAPSIVATEMPPDECDDPVAAYGQCGGDSYEGSTCCRPGYECTAIADCYSECRLLGECSEGWGQCGGRGWEGPNCCVEGAMCLERTEWYSQCVPEARI